MQTASKVMATLPEIDPLKREIYGVRIKDQNLDLQHVLTIANGIYGVAENAHKAQALFERRKTSFAEELLGIARQCVSLVEFNEAISVAGVRYKAKHGDKALPRVFVQTASDIRAMYNEGVDLNTRDPATKELLSYSRLRAASSKSKRVATANLKAATIRAEESSKPEYLKQFETLAELMKSLSRQKEGTYLPACAPIEQATAIMRDLFENWTKEHPTVAQEFMSDEEDSEEQPERRQAV